MRRSPETAFIGLGANLGDPRAALDAAFVALSRLPDSTLRAASSLYRSAPIDSSGPDYLNAVVQLDTLLAPRTLLGELQRIERVHGRERPYRNAPRTLDLDLLLYGDEHLSSDRLTVPHPRIAERAFVLAPLLEVAPELRERYAAALAALSNQRVERLP